MNQPDLARHGDPHPEVVSARAEFTRAWAKAIAGMSYLPLGVRGVQHQLTPLTEQIVAALTAQPFAAVVGHRIGETLVELNFIDTAALRATLELFGGRGAPRAAP